MATTTLNIQGMTCNGCVNSVTRVLTGITGVSRADVDLAGVWNAFSGCLCVVRQGVCSFQAAYSLARCK